jgi:hypothetical protein
MSPVVEQILQQIDRVASAVRNRLSPTEQAQILQHLTHPTESIPPKHRANSFHGKALNLLARLDAQTWVNSLRQEWADRDITGVEQ